ncbi:MAG TPA: hypothetical protein VFN57_06760 [Thermomicrobiaceae bacterium]|nr:hypothetical protein [Thermomicrobiaceae bacterium]
MRSRPRRAGAFLVGVLLLLAGLLPAALPVAAAPDTANLYLIAIGDNGTSGPLVGCGDSLVTVPGIDIGSQPTTAAKITAALTALFAIHTAYYGQSGLYDSLYQANLHVDSVRLDGTRAIVHLSGTVNLRGVCDDPRALAQIKAEVLQFPGVTRADIVYQGDLLEAFLSGRGEHPGWRYFPETDHLVAGGFLRYWETFGGLATFGYPITEEFHGCDPQGWCGTMQAFERAIFEWHPGTDPARYDVQLELLGNIVAAHDNLLTTAPFQPITARSDANCTFYPQTGHRLCFGFRAYWQSHGGLAIFGYPISEEFTQNGVTVQYFQRQRLEYHPENPPAWRVEGGLLGVRVMAITGGQ